MTTLLLAVVLFFQGADCRSCDVLANAASALSEGNEVRFMGFIDKSMPGYEDLESNVSALTAQNDVSASLDVLSESGEGDKVEALVDWFLQMTSKDGTEHLTRRRQRVKVIEIKTKSGWKISRIDPISILGPTEAH
jgi:hypothetical protein